MERWSREPQSEHRPEPVEVRTLGPFVVRVAGQPVVFGAKAQRKPLDLLKVLVALGGESVPAEAVADVLWPDSDGDRAQHALATTLGRLRRLIGHDAVRHQDARLTLDPASCWVDANAFQRLLEEATRTLEHGDMERAWQTAQEAVALYRGPFLDGEYELPAVLSARERLHAAFLRHLRELGGRCRRTGQSARAVALYQKGLEVDDLAEELYEQLLECFLEQGRLVEGVALYQRCRRTFHAAVGIAPSERVERLHQALLSARAGRTAAAGHQEGAGAPAPPESSTDAAPVLEGERRTTTVVVFAIAGLAALTESMDPEESESLNERLEQAAAGAVSDQGGVVHHFARGEIVAAFGITRAHEDDPLRAVRAALALRERIRSPEAGLHGPALDLRTGIHTGLVVARLHGHREGIRSLVGEAVETAARLARQAGRDEILISARTHQLVEAFIETRPIDSKARARQSPAGRGRETGTYRVLGESAVRSRFEAAQQRGLTPFTGRARELALLRERLAQASSGHGQVVTVAGEPGVGKSRLLHEFAQALDGQRVTVLWGRCRADGSNTPYLPFLDALRRGLNIKDERPPAEQLAQLVSSVRGIDAVLEEYVPVYLHLLSIPGATYALPDHLQGEELRRAIHLALAGLVTVSAARRPIVFLMEDWHWADDSSHAALRFLLGVIAHNPVLVVLTYRPEDGLDLGSLSHHSHLVLDALGAAESEPIIRAALGAEQLPEGLAALIHRRTEGNPFFVEEVCRSLREQGLVRLRNREAVLAGPLEDLHLPETLQAVIRTRLDRLDAEAQAVLHLAAVIGREFRVGILERLYGNSAALRAALDTLAGLELIQQVRVVPEGHYVFKHVITREVAYATLLRQRRKSLHNQVAQAMEALYGERVGALAESLAEHFRQGERWARAALYFVKAAETAKAHYAYESALRLCDRALEAAAAGEGLETERCDALALQGDLHSLLGDLEAANARYEDALALAETPHRRRAVANKRHRPHSVTRAGARIVFYEHGSGSQTLLLANPIVYGLATFQPVLEGLSQEFRVITIDQRGTGRSDPLPRAYGIADHMQDVRAVIEAAQAAPVVGVGISRGSSLLVRLSLENPRLVSRLVLVGCPLDDGAPDTAFPIAANSDPAFVDALRRKDKQAILEAFVPTIISEPGTEELRRQLLQMLLKLPEATVLGFFARDPTMAIDGLLPRVAVPTLVMHGAEDRRVPLACGRYIAGRIPGAASYEFQGTGHLPNATAPGEFCAVLGRFVRTGTMPDRRAAPAP